MQLLRREAREFQVTGIASSVEDLIEMTRRLRPSLVLLDARFGVHSGGPAVLHVAAGQVILCGERGTRRTWPTRWLRACAPTSSRSRASPRSSRCSRLVLRDLLVVPAALASTLQAGRGGLQALDGVERRILVRIAQGETNREIARGLNLSERTVRRRVLRCTASCGCTTGWTPRLRGSATGFVSPKVTRMLDFPHHRSCRTKDCLQGPALRRARDGGQGFFV